MNKDYHQIMANKQGNVSSILDDLLAPADEDGAKMNKKSQIKSKPTNRHFDENFYSNMAAVVSDSDISEADPHKVASSIKDLDDMDADLFGDKFTHKSSRRSGDTSRSTGTSRSGGTPRTPRTVSPSVRGQTKVTSPARTTALTGSSATKHFVDNLPEEQTLMRELSPMVIKPSSAPGKMSGLSAASEDLKPGQKIIERPKSTPKTKPNYDVFDEDDPLAGLLSDEDLDLSEADVEEPRKKAGDVKKKRMLDVNDDKNAATVKHVSLIDRPPTRSSESYTSSEHHPEVINEAKAKTGKSKSDIIFSDDEDMLSSLDGGDKTTKTKVDTRDDGKTARSALDNLLGNKSVSSLLDKPEKQERTFTLDPKYIKGATGYKTDVKGDDMTFGGYMPSTAGSSRPSSRRSVRFEEDEEDKGEESNRPLSRGSSQSSGTTRQRAKVNLDWLIDPDMDDMKAADTLTGDQAGRGDGKMEDKTNILANAQGVQKNVEQSGDLEKTAEKESNWLGLTDDSESDNYDWLLGGSSTKPKQDAPKPSEDPRPVSEMKKGLMQRQTHVSESPNLVHLPQTLQTNMVGGEVTHSLERPQPALSDSISRIAVPHETRRRDSGLRDTTKSLSPFLATHDTPVTEYTQSQPSPVTELGAQSQQQHDGSSTVPSSQLHMQYERQQHEQRMQSERQQLDRQQFERQQLERQQQQLQQMMAQIQQQVADNRAAQQTLPSLSSCSVIPQRSSILHDPLYSRMDDETKVRKLEIELGCQESLMESTRRRNDEEIAAIETSYKNRLKVIEESYQERDSRWKGEHSQLLSEHIDKVKKQENDKCDIISGHNKRLEELEGSRRAEIDRLNQSHRTFVDGLKSEHTDTMERLKNIKNQEVQSLLDSNSTTKSIQAVINQMSSSARDIGHLQYKMDNWEKMGQEEREIHMRARDEQMKNMQDQLGRQQEEVGEERSKLHQLVASLEKQLVEQTRQMEQERWKVRQEESKLQAMQGAQDEDKRRWQESQAREKAALDKSKDELIEEQKSTLTQLYEERRTMADERSALEVQKKMIREREQEQTIKYIKVQAEMESVMKASEQERVRIKMKTGELEKEEAMFEGEWERLSKARAELEVDREHLAKLSHEVNAKSQHINEMLEAANQRRSEGDSALSASKQLESEQMHKSQQIQQRLLEIQEKEKLTAEERLRLSKERSEVERMRDSLLCVNCRTPVRDTDPQNFSDGSSLKQHTNPPMMSSMDKISASINADRSVRLWKMRAQQDKMFLQDENLFLEGLKHSPYH